MAAHKSVKIKWEDVKVGDYISTVANRTCNTKVHKIEEDHKILLFLPARRLHMGSEKEVTYIRNYGPKKPMSRRA